MRFGIGLLLCTLALGAAGAAPNNRAVLNIRHSPNATATVDTTVRIREQLPQTLFGFNVQHYNFEKDLWDPQARAVDRRATTALQHFPGALYRYPGGLVANRFSWQDAMGPPDQRPPQRAVEGARAQPVLFGVEEFLNFVRSVQGQPLYVLNLVGWDDHDMVRELPSAQVGRSNAQLAVLLKNRFAADGVDRIYELGNELDRSHYQWPHRKYIERSKDTISAIHQVDPDAEFIAFLREFDWRYKNDPRAGTVSRAEDLITDVLTGLPEVQGFSMHFYYDDPGVDKKAKQLPWRLRLFLKAIDTARRARDGRAPEVWITEHARGVNVEAGKPVSRAALTSNLAAAISTADFLTALAQVPEVRGAAWHALNGRAWQLFDATIEYKDMRPRPVYWGLRVLRALDLPVVLDTVTASPHHSAYAGGYDVRTAGFASDDGNSLGLWAVNRADRPTDLVLQVATWKNRGVSVQHYYLCGRRNVDADDPAIDLGIQLDPAAQPASFSATGTLQLRLPASSVSSFRISARPDSDGQEAALPELQAC